MISNVVPSVEYPVEGTDRVPGRRELIMNWPTDKTGGAGEQYVHAEWLAGCGTGKATSKRQPPSMLDTEISPPCDSTTPRAIARPRPAPPSSPLRDGVPRQPASNTRERLAWGIPPQLSLTATRI